MSESDDVEECMLNVEKIIIEVEKRPALYNKCLKDRGLKEKLWGEVCASVFNDWNRFSAKEKLQKGKLIQKKWKNLRDCFGRELAAQKKTKSGEGAKKRRKYLYFDALLFLLPCMEDKPTDGNNAAKEDEDIPNTKPNTSFKTPQRSKKRLDKTQSSYETSLLNILKEKQNEEFSEEKYFALMLVPMLEKLNDDQKHYAKVEILNIMKRAQHYHPPQNLYQPQTHHHNVPFPQFQSFQPTTSTQMQPVVQSQTLNQNQMFNSNYLRHSYAASSTLHDNSAPISPNFSSNSSDIIIAL